MKKLLFQKIAMFLTAVLGFFAFSMPAHATLNEGRGYRFHFSSD